MKCYAQNWGLYSSWGLTHAEQKEQFAMYRSNKYSSHFLCCFLKWVFSMFPENNQCSVISLFLKKHPEVLVISGFCVHWITVHPSVLHAPGWTVTHTSGTMLMCIMTLYVDEWVGIAWAFHCCFSPSQIMAWLSGTSSHTKSAWYSTWSSLGSGLFRKLFVHMYCCDHS